MSGECEVFRGATVVIGASMLSGAVAGDSDGAVGVQGARWW